MEELNKIKCKIVEHKICNLSPYNWFCKLNLNVILSLWRTHTKWVCTCECLPVSPQSSGDRWVRRWAVPPHQSSQEHKHVCPALTHHVSGAGVWRGQRGATNYFMTQAARHHSVECSKGWMKSKRFRGSLKVTDATVYLSQTLKKAHPSLWYPAWALSPEWSAALSGSPSGQSAPGSLWCMTAAAWRSWTWTEVGWQTRSAQNTDLCRLTNRQCLNIRMQTAVKKLLGMMKSGDR